MGGVFFLLIARRCWCETCSDSEFAQTKMNVWGRRLPHYVNYTVRKFLFAPFCRSNICFSFRCKWMENRLNVPDATAHVDVSVKINRNYIKSLFGSLAISISSNWIHLMLYWKQEWELWALKGEILTHSETSLSPPVVSWSLSTLSTWLTIIDSNWLHIHFLVSHKVGCLQQKCIDELKNEWESPRSNDFWL